MNITIPCYPNISAFIKDQRRIEKEDNMKNLKQMGHFIGWKFGVPVRVSSHNFSLPYTEQVLLISENDNSFTVMFTNFIKQYTKEVYQYELIPHRYNYPGGANKPRYPVCESLGHTTFCNSLNKMDHLDTLPTKIYKFSPIPIATLIIDGKTIELSAETTAELKKKLGV